MEAGPDSLSGLRLKRVSRVSPLEGKNRGTASADPWRALDIGGLPTPAGDGFSEPWTGDILPVLVNLWVGRGRLAA